MTLRVSNTLTGQTEVFEPTEPGRATMYYCGLTVSDDAHLGHARSWVHTDVIRRWLEHLGYAVRHVENFTDVNEKIIAKVGVDGEDEASVAAYYTDRVIEDMRSLNLRRAHVHPRVSEHTPEIVDLIERLIEDGHAYEANGSVYFDVTTFPAYGRLSNQQLSEMAADEERALAEKRNPQDFALWKAGRPSPDEIAPHQQADELSADAAAETAMTFDSPWGEGRPGWHIECSAMSTTHLGDTFDIHLAGHDILFPHNENEIAQSEAATDQPFARYWLHTGLLRTEGEKMSSSLQNFFRVRDAVAEYGPNVIRMFYLSSVYSADQLFSEVAIAEAEERWERLERAMSRGIGTVDSIDAGSKATDPALRRAVDGTATAVTSAMNDDFNTREAVAALLDLAGEIHRHIDGDSPYDYQGLLRAVCVLEEYGGDVFGLEFDTTRTTGQEDALVELILELREQERTAGNFERADELRSMLADLGIAVEDTDEGPVYRR